MRVSQVIEDCESNLVLLLFSTRSWSPLLKRVQPLTSCGQNLGCRIIRAKSPFFLPRVIPHQYLHLFHALKKLDILVFPIYPMPCFPPLLGWILTLPSPYAHLYMCPKFLPLLFLVRCNSPFLWKLHAVCLHISTFWLYIPWMSLDVLFIPTSCYNTLYRALQVGIE